MFEFKILNLGPIDPLDFIWSLLKWDISVLPPGIGVDFGL